MADMEKQASGGEGEFLAAYDRYADAIFRHCYFRVADRAQAKDLAQETFMRAWEYMASGKESVGNIRALIYRIAHNLVVDGYRRQKEDSLDALVEDGSFQPSDLKAGAMSEELGARMAVNRLLERLGESDRRLIVMRHLEDLSPGDIGAILGESENAVSVRIHRAMGKMRGDPEAGRYAPL
jgi:RNA polymerase sigma-70 factor (ECF subfamily)